MVKEKSRYPIASLVEVSRSLETKAANSRPDADTRRACLHLISRQLDRRLCAA